MLIANILSYFVRVPLSEKALLFFQVCLEKYTSKTDLEVHTVVHSLDPDRTCHSCAETFTDEDQLRDHKCSESDTGVKPSALEHSPSFDLNTVVPDFFLFPAE